MREKQMKVFDSDNLWKSIFQMVVPSLIVIVVMLLYNMADMVFVGQTGETVQVAAVSVVGPVFSLLMAFAMLLSGGGMVLISRDLGAKSYAHAKMVSSLCMWGAIISGVIAGILIIVFRYPILKFLGATADMEEYAISYMVILALGAPFLMISNLLGQLLRAEGAMTDGLIGNILGTLLNLILDPIFILGFHMGVTGAAIATVIGNAAATLYYLNYFRKKAVVLNLNPANAIKQPFYIFSIMALGLPNAVSTLLSGFAGSFANQLLSKYGSDAIAANAAAGRVNMIIVMVLMGICMGAQPLISYNYGAKNMKKISGVLKRLAVLVVVFGGVTTLLVIVFRAPVIGLFLKDKEVAQTAEGMLSIIMLSSPFLGFFYLSTNFLQSVGKAIQATLLSVFQKGLFLIPLLFLLESIIGFDGIRWAYVAADMLSVVIALSLFVIGWKKLTHQDKVAKFEKREKLAS